MKKENTNQIKCHSRESLSGIPTAFNHTQGIDPRILRAAYSRMPTYLNNPLTCPPGILSLKGRGAQGVFPSPWRGKVGEARMRGKSTFTARSVIPVLQTAENAGYRRRAAFTLIELLVVILIIGILAVIALPQYQYAVAKARIQQAIILGTALNHSLQRYYLEHGEYTADWKQLDIALGGKEISYYNEGAKGYSNDLNFPWGRCVLRTYSIENPLCETYKPYITFLIHVPTQTKTCIVSRNNSIAHKVCQAVTGDTKPNGNSYKFQ